MFSTLAVLSGDVSATLCIIWIFDGNFVVHNLCLYKNV